jgi:DNA gyrase subunit A
MLFKNTQMQDTFGAIMLALVNNQPKVLNLKEIIANYVEFQEDVIRRRTKFDLEKALARAHILEGLLIALDNIDDIIKTIRESYDDAKERLMERFNLSDKQAQAILDMRLARLQGLEKEKLENEYKELEERIAYFRDVLQNEFMVLDIIKNELKEIKDKFGDERRTEISNVVDDIDIEDLIEEEENVITLTHFGYVKRMPSDTYRIQKKGGRGITGLQTREEDYVEHIISSSTHNTLLFFTNMGRMYRLKAYQLPEAGRQAKGTPIINLLPVENGERITALISIKAFEEDKYIVMVTKNGIVKRTDLCEYDSVRKNSSLLAITLDEGDELISVKLTDGKNDIIVGTHNGMAIRFNEDDVRKMGRVTRGVKAISLRAGDIVEGAAVSEEGEDLLVVTENGYGKKTNITEYRSQTRGGIGLKNYNISEKTGSVIAMHAVTDNDDIMLITNEGVVIRLAVSEIRAIGRSTAGVRLMKLSEGVKVVSVAKCEHEDEKSGDEITEESTEQSPTDE